MISFDSFQINDDSPIYLQILSFIKRGCVAGTINDGDELPSRRYLSALLGINPMTVQKAFRALEDERLISSSAGITSVVTLTAEKKEELHREMLQQDVRRMIGTLKDMGISQQEAFRLIDEYWEGEQDEKTHAGN